MEINDFLHAVLGGPAVRKLVSVGAEEYMTNLKRQHPQLTQPALVSLAYENLCGNDEWLEAGLKYFLFNTLNNVTKKERYHSSYWTEQRKQRGQAISERAREYVKQIKTSCIADFVCPNKKTIRENTGTYLGRMGGAFAQVGKAAGTKVVGKVLSDEQVDKLFKERM